MKTRLQAIVAFALVLGTLCLARAEGQRHLGGVKWADLPERLVQKEVPVQEWNVVDCPAAIRQQQKPTRSVAQVIENTFYLWDEFALPQPGGGKSACLFMQKPENKPLKQAEARTLLTASTLWRQLPPPSGRGRELQPDDPSLKLKPMPLPRVDPAERGKPRARPAGPVGDVPHTLAPPRSRPGAAAGKDSKVGARGVIGADDRWRCTRTESFPWYTLCYLQMYWGDSGYRGSGCLVTPYMVLSCGHNVFDQDSSAWVDSIEVVPGQRESSFGGSVYHPWGEASAGWVRINRPYTEGERWAYDYSAVFLKEPFWSVATYMPVVFDSEWTKGETLNIAGYPGNAQDNDTYGLWVGSGPFDSVEDEILWHTANVTSGNSGGPTYYIEDSGLRCIFAIVAGGGPEWNCGPFLGGSNKDLIVKWMQETPDFSSAGSPAAGGVARNARETDSVPTLQVKRGESFTRATGAEGTTQLMLARSANPSEADLRLLVSGGKLSAYFEGQWVAIGKAGAVPATFGKTFKLAATQGGATEVVLTFDHSLKPGDAWSLYQKQGEEWVQKARVVCVE